MPPVLPGRLQTSAGLSRCTGAGCICEEVRGHSSFTLTPHESPLGSRIYYPDTMGCHRQSQLTLYVAVEPPSSAVEGQEMSNCTLHPPSLQPLTATNMSEEVGRNMSEDVSQSRMSVWRTVSLGCQRKTFGRLSNHASHSSRSDARIHGSDLMLNLIDSTSGQSLNSSSCGRTPSIWQSEGMTASVISERRH